MYHVSKQKASGVSSEEKKKNCSRVIIYTHQHELVPNKKLADHRTATKATTQSIGPAYTEASSHYFNVQTLKDEPDPNFE
jgi:hypothetical protein